jgi:hypothetical protein
MRHWLETTVLPAVLMAALLLLLLWPTRRGGRRLLRTWGIPEPRDDQVGVAVRYLWQRRLLYVVLIVALPSLAGLADGLPGAGIVVSLLVAMLVAELVATLRPVSGIRSASLDRRTWRDLVPRWAVRTFAAALLVTAVAAAVSGTWLALAHVAACPVAVGGLVALAVRRPSAADEAVDAALRTRTARVAVGIGLGWTGFAFTGVTDRFRVHVTGRLLDAVDITTFAVVVMSIVCWLWVAMPSRRSLATAT